MKMSRTVYRDWCEASQITISAAVLLMAGCAYVGSARDFDPAEFSRDPRWLRCDAVPLILQREQKDCGAAAAAMVLAHWNRPVAPGEISARLKTGENRRIGAEDLLSFLESRGLQAFLVPGTAVDLERQVLKGRPVIVGLVKPFLDRATPHYEVVVAVHPVEKRVVTLDPARGWRENHLDGLFAEWEPAGRLLLVAWEPE